MASQSPWEAFSGPARGLLRAVGPLLVVDLSRYRAEPLFEHTAFARVVLFDGSEPLSDEGADGHAVTRPYVRPMCNTHNSSCNASTR